MSKTFDCFTFFNELDLLEIRLNILDKDVDFFVICESTETFQGNPKPLYYELNKERFAKWKDKIIHIVSPVGDFYDSFERARYQKEYIINYLDFFCKCEDDDVIYFGDLDEIWKPQIVDGKVYKLRQLNYCYYFNNRSSEDWRGTIVGRVKNIKEKGLNWHRANPENILQDGGWHFTNMGGAEQIRKKLEAYDHKEFNFDHIKEDLENKIYYNEDYVGRAVDWQGKPFAFWSEEVDLPQFIKDNRDKYVLYFR